MSPRSPAFSRRPPISLAGASVGVLAQRSTEAIVGKRNRIDFFHMGSVQKRRSLPAHKVSLATKTYERPALLSSVRWPAKPSLVKDNPVQKGFDGNSGTRHPLGWIPNRCDGVTTFAVVRDPYDDIIIPTTVSLVNTANATAPEGRGETSKTNR